VDGRLAQLAALVAHGNAWLAGDRQEPTGVADGTTFQFVRAVAFELTTGPLPTHARVQDDPDAWLRACAERGATAICLDPRVARAGPGSIVVMGRARERWQAEWTVHGVPRTTDRRIWDVRYVGREERGGPVRTPDIDAAHATLEGHVRSARELATRFGWTDWSDWFSEALESSSADPPVARFHPDVLPASADLDRRRLFALASGSHVFGGMGSWNDVAIPKGGEGEYQRVSAALYEAILDAVGAAVNPRRRPA
jgi:hypothetical protein